MNGRLEQSDFEDLSAYLDGELPDERAEQIRLLIESDPAWSRAAQELRSVQEAMDDYVVPAADDGLAGRILAGIPTGQLTETQAEELSAYVDGELAPSAAEAVERSVRTDATWRQSLKELKAVEEVLDSYTVPAAPAELPGRIVAASRRLQRRAYVLRAVEWLVPAAAAAAIVLIGLAVLGGGSLSKPTSNNVAVNKTPTISPELAKSQAFKSVPVEQRPALQDEIIRNLNFFSNYDVVADYDTLQAIDQLDSHKQGT